MNRRLSIRQFHHGLLACLSIALPVLGQGSEEDYYTVEYLSPPAGEIVEVGGMDVLPGGRLILSTRRGQVWIVDDAFEDDPARASYRLFAEGLRDGLGLKVVDGQIYVLQRGELSRLVDEDDDGTCDRIDTIANGWGLSGNYHEFAFGLPVDAEGNFYMSLNVAFLDPQWWHGKSVVPWRGWVLRVSPEGVMTPLASGFRSPCGLGWNAEGDLFATDNQGDWMPVGPIYHVQEGRFYGHPASLDWTDEYRASKTYASDTIPPERERAPAAVWLPYKWSRSAGNLVTASTGGFFGPFEDQLFVAELTNGNVIRVQLEKVRGEYQGACFLFRQNIGSICRLRFGPDGCLYAGFTNRGWGGLPPSHGLARLRWTDETPMEMHSVHLLQDGFEIRFTLPVASDVTLTPSNVNLLQYDYDYWWEYGSPERDLTPLEVRGVELAADRQTLTVRAKGLTAGRVARLVLTGVRAENGAPLLHDEFAYTVNQLPEGEPTADHVAKVVPPPPARAAQEEGWLRLTYGDALDAWNSEGWELCAAVLDPADRTRFITSEGVSALANTASESPSDYVSKYFFGDVELHLEFTLPEAGDSGVLLMGRYEVQLADTGTRELSQQSCGGIVGSKDEKGTAPRVLAYKGPGQPHDLDLVFRAPRFDADGKKVRNARFERVAIDDVVVQEDVELPAPSNGAPRNELAYAPIILQGTRSPVVFGDVRAKRLDRRPDGDGDGWVMLLEGDDLTGWKISDGGTWELEDGVLLGEGERSHIFSPRGDYRNFELRVRIKLGENGNSGLFFRTTYGSEWPAGYEAQINSSFPDPQKTGSLYDMAPVSVQLVGDDTWFDYHVTCRDEAQGTRVQIRVNGTLVTDHLDRERKHELGHVALQQHHQGSVVEVRDLAIRELP